ncbi:MAG: helix-turn-helix domain-containing protein [Paracoccaceae bacterium]
MAMQTRIGARIRAKRGDLGLRQADLARSCGISPSYLNLIEHERRRIGGALLVRIAGVLQIEPELLSEGAETALTTALRASADVHNEANPEVERLDEFAARYPGWAQIIEAQHGEVERLQRLVSELSDRLTYDPFLSASMHEVLSSVTAVRSASAILADGGEISPEWQARFHRNIYEDSQRLATSTEALVGYLDAGGNAAGAATLPQDEVEAWLAELGWSVPVMERNPDCARDEVPGLDEMSTSAAALADIFLAQYRRGVSALPYDAFKLALSTLGADPVVLAAHFAVGLPVVFRRLASLASEDLPDGQPRGLVACDASGTLTFRKPVPGFDVPHHGSACALWPLFHAASRPASPIRQDVRAVARDEQGFETFAFAEVAYPSGYNGPPVVSSWMLISPQTQTSELAQPVGMSCRICAVEGCPARREPSIVSTARDTPQEMDARL